MRKPGVLPVICTKKDTSENLTGTIMHVGFCLLGRFQTVHVGVLSGAYPWVVLYKIKCLTYR